MNIQVFHATAGQGHKKVAEVITQAFKKRGLNDSQIRVSDVLEIAPKSMGMAYPAAYFYSVKYIPKIWGWFYETLDKMGFYRWVYPIRRFHNQIMGAKLLSEIEKDNPDLLINCHFFTAEHFAHAKRKGQIKAKLITVITDFFPHSFWVNEGTDYYWVMGDEGKKELIRRGIPENQIIAGGIPVAEAFKPTGRKDEILTRFGFKSDRLTLLFTSGSFGLGHQEAILKELEPFKDQVQCFVVCGNNKDLQKTLSSQSWSFPIQVFGFIDFMADLMEASDLMLAKSGGSTTTESLAKGLPMVILEPIPGQETRNAQLLLARNASFSMTEPAQIKTILKALFENPKLLQNKHQEIRKMARPNAADDFVTFCLELISKGSHV